MRLRVHHQHPGRGPQVRPLAAVALPQASLSSRPLPGDNTQSLVAGQRRATRGGSTWPRPERAQDGSSPGLPGGRPSAQGHRACSVTLVTSGHALAASRILREGPVANPHIPPSHPARAPLSPAPAGEQTEVRGAKGLGVAPGLKGGRLSNVLSTPHTARRTWAPAHGRRPVAGRGG